MKSLFDKHQTRLTPEEKQALWRDLRANLPGRRSSGFLDSWTGFWRRFWAWPLAGALATAVLLVVFLHERTDVPVPTVSPSSRTASSAARSERGEEKAAGTLREKGIAADASHGRDIVPAPEGGPVEAPEAGGPEPSQSDRSEPAAVLRSATPQATEGRQEGEAAAPGFEATSPPASGNPALSTGDLPASLGAVVRGQRVENAEKAKGGPGASTAQGEGSGEVTAGSPVQNPPPAADRSLLRPEAHQRGGRAKEWSVQVPAPDAETAAPAAPKAAAPKAAAPNAAAPNAAAPKAAASNAPGREEIRAAAPRAGSAKDAVNQADGPVRSYSVRVAPESRAVVMTDGLISGTIADSTGKPLAYANVIVAGTSWGAFSLEDGSFRIPHVPDGTYTLRVSMLGYSDARIENVRVSGGRSEPVRVVLSARDAGSLQEVEILARREVIQQKRSGTSVSVDGSPALRLKAESNLRGGRLQFNQQAGSVPASPSQPPVLPTTGGETLPNDEVYDSMFFKHYGVNPFIPTDEDSLSTFAVDVDNASYTVMRRYVELGHLPPQEAVRVEEFVNFFPQGYGEFERPDFKIFVEGAPSPFGKGYTLLRVGIKAREIADANRAPANLTFVIDCSGSMEREDRLELVKRALRILVDQLGFQDRIGIVVFGTDARVLLDPTGLQDREDLLRAIDRLRPEGSTNAEAGLRLGYEMAGRMRRDGAINRIILCSDGVANVGRTGPESILEEVRREAGRGIQLTTIGFGMGNYNDVLMEQLADKGDGNYYYVDDLPEARRVLQGNLTGTLQTIAKDAKIQVEFDSRRVLRYRLLGFENRDVADRDFRNDKVDAGEIGAGHEVTALYEIKLARGVERGRIATVRLRYLPAVGGMEKGGSGGEEGGSRDDRPEDGRPDDDRSGRERGSRAIEISEDFDAGDLELQFNRASAFFRLDAGVAEFAEILRGSFWAKESRIDDVLPVIRPAADDLGSETARELVRLVEKARTLSEKLTPEERKQTIDRWRNEPDWVPEGPIIVPR